MTEKIGTLVESLNRVLQHFSVAISEGRLVIQAKNRASAMVRVDRLPRDGLFLADSIPDRELDKRIADIGAGTGVVSAGLWTRGCHSLVRVEADTGLAGEPIVALTSAIIKVPSYVGDILDDAGVLTQIRGRYDLVALNPPQLPGSYNSDRRNLGGMEGVEFTERLLQLLRRRGFFQRGGVAYLVAHNKLSTFFGDFCHSERDIQQQIVRDEFLPISQSSKLKDSFPESIQYHKDGWPEWIRVRVHRIRASY